MNQPLEIFTRAMLLDSIALLPAMVMTVIIWRFLPFVRAMRMFGTTTFTAVSFAALGAVFERHADRVKHTIILQATYPSRDDVLKKESPL
jgi:hypothetical protein